MLSVWRCQEDTGVSERVFSRGALDPRVLHLFKARINHPSQSPRVGTTYTETTVKLDQYAYTNRPCLRLGGGESSPPSVHQTCQVHTS
jgi:hypothetical protein